jgi:transposase
MHKALTQMNLQIQHVITDLTGLTDLAIVDAILEGERNPSRLAELRDPRVKASSETIEKSLVGHWLPEHLFTLKQSRRLYADYQREIGECDAEIEQLVGSFQRRVDPQLQPLPPDRKKNRNYAKSRKRRTRLQSGT